MGPGGCGAGASLASLAGPLGSSQCASCIAICLLLMSCGLEQLLWRLLLGGMMSAA